MKKIYSLLAMSTIVGASFAQIVENAATSVRNDYAKPFKVGQKLNKALGTEFWSNDFSTPADWTIDNGTQTSPTGWNVGATHGHFFTAGINSTSGGNYARVNNGTTSSTAPVVGSAMTLTTANSIDVSALSTNGGAILKFQQYGAMFFDAQEVQISVDGTTFTTVFSNDDKDPLTSTGGSAYGNPENISINITDAIAGNPSTVWIRFNWNSSFPNETLPQAWYTYGWLIDDVSLVSLPDNDVVVSSSQWGSLGAVDLLTGVRSFTKIPTSQVTEINFLSSISNEGEYAGKNVKLNVNINSGVYNTTLNVDSLPAGFSDSLLILDPAFTPAATVGSYTAVWTVSGDSTDDNPSNNMIENAVFEVTEFIYSLDNGVVEGSFDLPGDDENFTGNIFPCFATDDLYAIDFVVGDGSNAGAEVKVLLFEVLSRNTSSGEVVFGGELESSSEYTLTNADVSNNATISLKLDNPFTLVAGKDYAAVVQAYGGAGTAFAIATSGEHAGLFKNNGAYGFFGDVNAMIRMNFENTLVATASSNSAASPICKGDVVNFESNTVGGVPSYTFSWNFGDGTTSTLANPTHTYSSSGQKPVVFTVTDNGTPVKTTTKTFNVTIANCFTSIEENSLEGILVSQNMPNPFNELSVVNFELASSEVVTFELLDVAGKLVRTMNLGNLNSGAHSVTIDAKELNSGIYYYSIITGNAKVTNKMVVKK